MMFDSSVVLFFQYALASVGLSWLLGLFLVWSLFGNVFKGFWLYIYAYTLGMGVHAAGLFLLQFLGLGVGWLAWCVLLVVLVVLWLVRLFWLREDSASYIGSLRLDRGAFWAEISADRVKQSWLWKVLSGLSVAIVSLTVVSTFLFSSLFPTYRYDSVNNRHRPIVNILDDGGVQMFGAEEEILGRARVGYPIHIPLVQANSMYVAGGYNDIYVNFWNRTVFIMLLLAIFGAGWTATRSLKQSILPVAIVCSMPLIPFHGGAGHLDIATVLYALLMMRTFWQYCEATYASKKSPDKHVNPSAYLLLCILFGGILTTIKNDGLIVMMPAVVFGIARVVWRDHAFRTSLFNTLKTAGFIWKSIGIGAVFYLQFPLIKMYHGLGYNQAADQASQDSLDNVNSLGLSSEIHREVVSHFEKIFVGYDNYNLIVLLLIILFFAAISQRKRFPYSIRFLIVTPVMLFGIFLLVFLITPNYEFALNQMTINRVFTLCFILLFAFGGIIWNRLSAR